VEKKPDPEYIICQVCEYYKISEKEIKGMKLQEGTIKEYADPLFKNQLHGHCPKCGVKLQLGLMSIANHWPICLKNPKFLKHTLKTPLIESVEKAVSIKPLTYAH
jgi:ssDNA-binding Zn-finger/Zn-ribbon topoisomerase 1